MAIAYVNATGTELNVSGTTFTVNVPSGVSDGDALLLAVTVDSSTTTVSTPAGWTLVAETGAQASGTRTYLYKRIAASEPASYTITLSASGTNASAIIGAWSGMDSAIIDAYVAQNYNYQGNNNRTSTGITNGDANNWSVFIGSTQGNSEPVVSATGHTSRFNTEGVGGYGAGSRLFDSNGTRAAGALAGVAWVVSNDQRSASIFLTLKAAGAAANPPRPRAFARQAVHRAASR